MPEHGLTGQALIESLQDRIDEGEFEFYFSARNIEGDQVVEYRYYYFVDVALMYHDKQEKHPFLPVSGVMDRLDQIEPIDRTRPLYLDYVQYDFDTDTVTHGGFSHDALQLLLEYFWSDTSSNFSDNSEIFIKSIDKTQFLDLSETTILNAPITVSDQ